MYIFADAPFLGSMSAAFRRSPFKNKIREKMNSILKTKAHC